VALHTDRRAVGDVRARGRRAYNLGPASERPYLNHEMLERALLETGADAAWVGWGFVAEDPAFAEVCAPVPG
jgi:acetyl/propionyl-CoA carboxylase alpha subunit